jgi:hypothetical protein
MSKGCLSIRRTNFILSPAVNSPTGPYTIFLRGHVFCNPTRYISLLLDLALSVGAWFPDGNKYTPVIYNNGGLQKMFERPGYVSNHQFREYAFCVPDNSNAGYAASMLYVDAVPISVVSTVSTNVPVSVSTINITSSSLCDRQWFSSIAFVNRCLSISELQLINRNPNTPLYKMFGSDILLEISPRVTGSGFVDVCPQHVLITPDVNIHFIPALPDAEDWY